MRSAKRVAVVADAGACARAPKGRVASRVNSVSIASASQRFTASGVSRARAIVREPSRMALTTFAGTFCIPAMASDSPKDGCP